MPRHLHRPKHALGVRHQDGETSVRRRQAGDTTRRAIGVVWIKLGHLVSIVDEAKGRQRIRGVKLRVTGPFVLERGEELIELSKSIANEHYLPMWTINGR